MKNRGKTTMLRINETTKKYVVKIASEQMDDSGKFLHLGEALQAFIEKHRPDLINQIREDKEEDE